METLTKTKHPHQTSFRLSPNAKEAIAKLALALDVPQGKLIELAVLRLEEEWRAGRVLGVGIKVDDQQPVDD